MACPNSDHNVLIVLIVHLLGEKSAHESCRNPSGVKGKDLEPWLIACAEGFDLELCGSQAAGI